MSRIISYYGGPIIIIIIGSYSIFKEKVSGSLNILTTKPIYRDTIINGKLLGIIYFLMSFIILSMMLYLSALLIFFGNVIGDKLILIIDKLPLTFIVTFLCLTIFLSISILLSVIVKEIGIAILSNLIIWMILMVYVKNILIAGYIGHFIEIVLGLYVGSVADFISFLSPYSIGDIIIFSSDDIILAIMISKFEFIKLLMYTIIPLLFAYVGFIKRDIV